MDRFSRLYSDFSSIRTLVLGAGGMAREIKWLIEEINLQLGRQAFVFCGYIVSDLEKLKETDSSSEVRGDFEWLRRNSAQFDAVLVGVGTPQARKSLLNQLQSLDKKFLHPSLIHPSVTIDSQTSRMGEGCIVCAGARITVNVTLGSHVIVNQNCTVAHESSVGSYSVLGPSSNISGGVSIAESVLVGTGAQVLQYRSIEHSAIIGAGAVVTRDVKESATVIGIPAREI